MTADPIDTVNKARAAILELDAEQIIAAIEHLARIKGDHALHNVFWQTATLFGIEPVVVLDVENARERFNEDEADNAVHEGREPRFLTADEAQDAAFVVGGSDWSYLAEQVSDAFHEQATRIIRDRYTPEENSQE